MAATDPLESAQPLSAYGRDAKALSPEQFSQRHGTAFLVETGTTQTKAAKTAWQGTVVIDDPKSEPSAARPTYSVYAVRRTGRSSSPAFITVGRTVNNDVVLTGESITKFHAYFAERNGVLSIQDAGSKNGTFVNDSPVPAKSGGAAVALQSGDRVRFGTMEFTFLLAPEFCAFVNAMAS